MNRRAPSPPCNGPDDCPDRKNPPVTLDELHALQGLPEVAFAVARIGNQTTMIYRDHQLKGVGYDAYTTDWIRTDRADISPGRSFTEAENLSAAPVIIVNDTLKSQLFGDS